MLTPEFTGDKAAYTKAILETCPPRYAEQSDVDALVAFDRQIFPEGGMGPRYLSRAISDNPIGLEMVEVGGQIAAYTHGVMYPSAIAPGRGYGDIASIGVAEGFRGRGLGELMLGRMVDSMLTEDPTGICLHTRVSNLPMQRLAAKFGFVVERTDIDYYARTARNEDAYLMVLRRVPLETDD
jgi:ribosomal protein S18 acetylase RimI-like enzyme